MAKFLHKKFIATKSWQIFWKTVIYGNICQIWKHLVTLAIITKIQEIKKRQAKQWRS